MKLPEKLQEYLPSNREVFKQKSLILFNKLIRTKNPATLQEDPIHGGLTDGKDPGLQVSQKPIYCTWFFNKGFAEEISVYIGLQDAHPPPWLECRELCHGYSCGLVLLIAKEIFLLGYKTILQALHIQYISQAFHIFSFWSKYGWSCEWCVEKIKSKHVGCCCWAFCVVNRYF